MEFQVAFQAIWAGRFVQRVDTVTADSEEEAKQKIRDKYPESAKLEIIKEEEQAKYEIPPT